MSPTAASAGLLACHGCGLLNRPAPGAPASRCARCGATLHLRKPHSVSHTWALLIAAAILYLPANLLPVLETRSVFGVSHDTIVGGVVFLWASGSWPLALLVFFASVMVPLLKLIGIALLLVTIQRRSRWRPRERARLYRMVEFVGRWSMLDIYVVTLLVALVRLQSVATMSAGPGALAFGAVVVLTMLAATSLDPRLIWDPLNPPHDRAHA